MLSNYLHVSLTSQKFARFGPVSAELKYRKASLPGEPMRKPLSVLLAFVLVASSAEGVSASPDCQRWLTDYKKALSEKTAAQHLLAARNRARAAARRRLAGLTAPPAPLHPPTRISSVRPHLSPAQMLKRFDLLCGDLPVEPQVLDSRMSPDDFISEVAMGGPVETLGSPADDTLLAENTVPVLPVNGLTPETPVTGVPQVPIFGPTFGGIGVPTSPGSPSGPSQPPGTPVVPPVPPLAPVPEPGSILLVLTGVLGAGFTVRRSVS